MVTRLRGERGATNVVEVMMVVLIVSIIAGIGAPLLKQITNFWFQTVARSDIQKDVRAALDNVNRFLRQARRSTVIIDQKNGQPPYSRLAFSTLDGKSYAFWQENNNFKMSVSTNSTTVTSSLSNRVGYLAFTYPRTDDVSIISVAVTMQAPTYLGGKKTLQLSIQKVRVMNE